MQTNANNIEELWFIYFSLIELINITFNNILGREEMSATQVFN
jgi:hypothetical protein